MPMINVYAAGTFPTSTNEDLIALARAQIAELKETH